ncbi:HNH endonuclease domain-containing protein [Flavobacterium sp. NG2]|uniref:type II CRISPR RNA-guided endonuclease Cas9 n=1 Tax=Flavobacterium sp. NG2 TaxID=3097547 RepID=UPI002A826908|nr:type II CRISPR RNA-guided endonuclease Cas9 [Flavobacterium sp. NG2]WPR71041.1 HNH endonuclease domain-containing protein [Flavobacterium sp. NG2]
MAKILGLDLGTNSIGWAIRDNNIDNKNQILDSGVIIFPQGVGEEKGVEFSLASERTKKRASRKLYSRRKQRKSDLLKLLIENGMCPLTIDELNNWALYTKGKSSIYPTENFDFREWLKINPYKVRSDASNASVSNLEFGRALYHICQRRGFKSGRKDADAGKDLVVYLQERENRGDKTLGEYLFEQLEKGEKVRKAKYKSDDNEVNSSRISYVEEFNVLVKNQKLDIELTDKLFKAIFFQRPLKSQKGSIGKCTLETSKTRCAVSHPLFEEFRMYQFLNSIKVKERNQDKFQFLSNYPEFFELTKELFFRKSKPSFKFSEISKAVNTKAKKNNLYFEFNYNDKFPIVGNPTMSLLKDVFESNNWEDCKEIIQTKYKLLDKKYSEELIEELWHTLFFSGDFVNDVTSDKVKHFIRSRYDISEEQVDRYEKINLKQGYGSLSKKAIINILPFLRQNIIYSHAVFYANIPQIIGKEKWEENKGFIQDNISNIIDEYKDETLKIDIVNSLLEDFVKEYDNSDAEYILDETDKKNVFKKIISFYGKDRWNKFSEEFQNQIQSEIAFSFETQLQKRRFGGYHLPKPRLDEIIKQFLIDEFRVSMDKSNKLYHPSAIETYQESSDGLLGSPFTASVRNPMAMRTLHYLRKLVNSLLREKKISSDTNIIIELARELNDKNKRLAIERWQRERQNENKKIKEKLDELAKDTNSIVTETDIIKYRLCQEQGGKCLYTNKTISCEKLLGSNLQFDIEHTFPRSKSFDNSLVNKTLADKSFNQLKGNKIPQELDDVYIQNVLINIKDWAEKIEDLKEKIEQQRYFSRVASTVEQKDRAIQQRHYLSLEFNYWNEKYKRFIDKEINPKFKNSQLVDTGIITKFSKLFLESLFDNVFPAKGTMVADIRQSWGLPKKDRTLHYHHAIDAIVLTCMDKSIRDSLAQAFNESEELGKIEKFKVLKPWTTFTEDIDKLKESILVVHNHKDNLLKQTKRKLKKRNKLQYDKSGKVIYEKGEGIRSSLHLDTFYGAIERVNEKDEKEIWFVKRDWASNLNEASVENIVDEAIKQRIKKYGFKNLERTVEGFIILPEEENLKSMLIKKIRIKTNFKQLPTIKKQSHVSQGKRKEHKENYYAKLENIFAMAVYETLNEKGKAERVHKTISAFEVAKYNQGKGGMELPIEKNIIKNQGKKTEILIPLSYVLKVNQMVLFYENSKEEIKVLPNSELSKRLYKITQFENDSRINLRHHAQGDADKNLIEKSSLDFENPAQKLRIRLSNFTAIVENRDFEISSSGNITFLV